MEQKLTAKTFPLRVNQKWLDDIEKVRHKSESKHDFILNAVQKEVKRRETMKNANE